MSALWLIACAAAPVVLTALYMVRTRAVLRRLSCARFFPASPAGDDPSATFQLRPPPLTRAFIFQLIVLALLALAAGSWLFGWMRERAARAGTRVIVAVDLSASMTTLQRSRPRLAATASALRAALEELAAAGPIALELAAFDLRLRRPLLQVDDAIAAWSQVAAALDSLTPAHLPGNAALLQGLPAKTDCLVVISDQPAPEWARQPADGSVVWLDLAERVPNAGFTALTAASEEASGPALAVEIAGYSLPTPPPALWIEVNTNGAPARSFPLTLAETGAAHTWRGALTLPLGAPGLYRLRLRGLTDDAYRLDDEMAVRIEGRPPVRLEVPRGTWWADFLAGQSVPGGLRVAPARSWAEVERLAASGDATPTLVCWAQPRAQRVALTFFAPHTLLRGLNLNVVDGANFPTLPPGAPANLEPVLQGRAESGERLALALGRAKPPLVVIPEPPARVGGDVESAHVLLFANAVEFLREAHPPAPLYTLTAPGRESVALAEPRLALHPGEGDTSRDGQSFQPANLVGSARAAGGIATTAPTWLWPLIAAALLLAAERLCWARWGRAWQ